MAYERQTWETGTVIPESKLLHIENGIYDVSEDVETKYNELNSALTTSTMFVRERFVTSDFTINANGSGNVSTSISKSGYTPIAVNPCYSSTSSVIAQGATITAGGNCNIYVRNTSSSEQTINYTFEIEYVKNYGA